MTRDTRAVVAFFSDAPWTGGAERYLCMLASGLDRNLFSPAVIMNRNPALERFRRWMKDSGIPVHDVSLRLPFTFSGVGEFVRILRSVNPAILHMNLPGPYDSQYSLVAPIARYAGVRRIVSTEHLPMVDPFWKGSVLKRFGTLWIDRVVTVSDDNVGHLVMKHHVPRGKIETIHIGIPGPGRSRPAGVREQAGLAEGDILLVMVGSFEERKGHRIMFGALQELPDSIHLAVAGEGEMERSCRHEVSELGLGGRVHFLGIRDDIHAVLLESDILVLPSRLEATPYVIVEAMAAGIPVVASGIFGIPELVEDGVTGILVPPGDEQVLARAITSLAGDPVRRVRMGKKSKERFRDRFTIERAVSDTVRIYEELLKR